ncbi:DUF4198 domain-containing protein [Sphingobium boeckii]|uniref:DUF4198 domain-containing protein n=1 Tax=Sphingobium boeckii TaxID=1082345 RepID=A0A7W9EDJ3_9SPHN|nr:DUF4198 domain-containing protein [Sphingobium boeckii]MBB5685157.1 hypothetical protein [Sphingobium boeckii]
MRLTKNRLSAMVFGGLLCTAPGVQAHMPYVLPGAFDVGQRDHITVESAFGEEPFAAEVAMRDAPFSLTLPDGSAGEAGPVTYLRDLSIFEADLKTPGTYRVTTGQRLGRKGQMYRVNGQWVMRGEDGAPPKGAEPVAVQSATLADAYVTRGQPTAAALKPRGEALEIQPITHPNSIASGSDATFLLLFDGKPLAGVDVTLFRAAGVYDGRKIAGQIKTDAAGQFTLKPDDAGRYLILVRHRTTAPAGSEIPYRSYTYTLAFDAA